ncbi:MAG: hypothetical protein A3C43_08625 [Candidatus Schekmanbacteria bacterium RIFCSPHIGHO2_02_FULL_38_11]|uniref:Uncharacterized protein n=1 Tax=Candidatus Schekmanbacteria bacterium RIFCSPLOWO2_12_FULL_38_15 TaxID=1817883 RepID=A0A1F7SFY2_9BACT|nr:MAG: hypothetical protein A2043_11310 [Candidatus Schekmanbacteria bacterium GWA2_38_9]OGL49426.1 MAG: hypothetical protein A3H37_07045 [Candidatus Schekmanbacteria bacterium RIFCSPLOWO2_02_FULL_38_14]OGL52651.1 MAG: hypothetical protein A3G31_11870 [Candidatus Schekmanbacteria bacterium RIFCSPLOWO2_12_FULL_38_15]OGL54445.1 MAG: hypothetical protein A3C43_08625 [Candidatus Schekmanbacteria bacterium RIFCSPHIGHO2_02_FULL_38_11]
MKLRGKIENLKVTLIVLLSFSFLVIFLSNANSANDSELYFSKGLLAFDEGRFDEAAIEFEKALQIDSENPNILFQLGKTYNRLKSFDESVEPLEKALKINPQIKGINYESGVAYFNTGEFEKALNEFDITIEKEPERGEGYYYKALSLFRLDKWNDAITYLQKALELVPEYKLSIHYYLGVSYSRVEENEKALKEFAEAEKLGAGSDIGESAKKFVDAITKRINAKKRWSVNASISWQYDDNVTLKPSSLDKARDEAKKGITLGKIKDKGDWRATFNLSGEYKLVDTKDFTFSGRYSLYQSVHRRLRAYNITGNQIAPTVSYRIAGPLRINFSYIFDYFELDEARYLESHTFFPSINLVLSKSALLQAFYRIQDKDYLQDPHHTPSDRRGRNYAFGLNQYYFFMSNKGYIKLNYVTEREETRGRDWDYVGNSLGTDIQIPMIFDTKVLLGFNWDKKDYNHFNSIFGDRRKDQEYDWSVEVAKDLGKYYTLSIRFNRIVNDSTLAFYNYDREVTSFNFTARF